MHSNLLTRFSADLTRLLPGGGRIGVAVSGGPDSLALLLLAAAARPDEVEAATVDHRLRSESATEASDVAHLCTRLGVAHATLSVELPRYGSLQAAARESRYAALADWAHQRGLAAVLTAHHADDQAETLLMRLARGSGLGGLSGVRCRRFIGGGDSSVPLLRPVLEWRRDELRAIVDEEGLAPVDDPSNHDKRFDRTRARQLLAQVQWLNANRLAASASNLADAEEAIEWATAREFRKRAEWFGRDLTVDPSGLPRELRRRLLLMAIGVFDGEPPRGDRLIAALDTLEAGGTCTLAGLRLQGGASWRLNRAPPRR